MRIATNEPSEIPRIRTTLIWGNSVRLPLFNIFDFPKHKHFYEAIHAAGPAGAWNLMKKLDALDRPIYRANQPDLDNFEVLKARALDFMNAVPGLDGFDLELHATSFAEYGPKLQFESTFINLWMKDPETLFRDVVDVDGREHLHEAASRGRGVIALPLHLGPSYVAIPMLAYEMPTTTLYNRMNFDEIRAASFPDLDFRGIRLGSTSAIRSAMEALSEGRIFSMFPELDPRGVDEHHARIPFLGTTIMVPTGPILLSYASGAPMVPLTLRGIGDGRFRLKYHPAIPPPASPDDRRRSVLAVWDVIESELLAGDLGEWEMWFEFDRMLPQVWTVET
ncbi:lysophospholipid acyltransferase family protein [Arthrobacter sp. KNU-44]|uniref:lysophospholipid acyltransferase family protein n=1 Tax=unclassified Arthrobacter TaxID=235627 RepID=UPI003F423CFE